MAKNKFMAKCPIPKLLTYNKLAAKIKEIDKGGYSLRKIDIAIILKMAKK